MILYGSRLESIANFASGEDFDFSELSSGEGFLILRVSSSGTQRPSQIFQNESGGHRWQRIPSTEKRGRVHTSTATVAILPDDDKQNFEIDSKGLIWRTTRGSGPGGQNLNKRANCVVLTHRPTGITVRIDSKSQSINRKEALRILTQQLKSQIRSKWRKRRNVSRQSQIGSGMRGDKIRTIRVHDELIATLELLGMFTQ